MMKKCLTTLVVVLIITVLAGSASLLQGQRSAYASEVSVQTARVMSATGTSEPTPSVKLRLSAPGINPITSGKITIPAGTKVTLTVVPSQSLKTSPSLTVGIYANDPYPFSRLQYCTYPKTDTCSYVIAYASNENTDYTKGTHTFQAFLGNIKGAILTSSNSITVTWS